MRRRARGVCALTVLGVLSFGAPGRHLIERTLHMAEDARLKKRVNMKFPAGCAHAYQRTDKNTGEIWDKVILNFPKGMRADGRDLGNGWYMVAFQNDRMRRQLESGGEVTFSVPAFKENRDTGEVEPNRVKAFLGPGKEAAAIDLNPWSVAIGLRDVRAQIEIANRPEDYPYEGNADDESSYGKLGGDPIEARAGGRTAPPRRKPAPSIEDDSFASRTRRMRYAAADISH